ncbi:chondroitin AC/alginate lyase [Crassisporium funariophilum]|nr:chondroitin AC/alginate lyase [Crassisporium funariophilum]
MRPTLFQSFAILSLFSTVSSQTAYANDFVDPDYILSKKFGDHTFQARQSILVWADSLAAKGPWSVMNKAVNPPSGDKHDYMSWAPYWWPDCSGVGNTTALSPEDVWKTCPYVNRDGQFNPDGRLVNDVGAFQDLAEATFYNAIAWTLDNPYKTNFENNAVTFIRTWFLDAATRMNPHLIYGQMQRGPQGQTGSHTGLLDLKAMSKITSAILLLRKGKSAAWTSDLDNQMIAWSREYITWLETADIAVEEGLADNNHGTFYYNQLAAMKIIVNDLAGAKKVTNTFFNLQYLTQIDANGEQPLEAARTRPYHYRSYNLAAMITNARLEKYVDPSSTVWEKRTNSGATIKTALDFAMTIPSSASKEEKYVQELYPNIAAVAAVYGDADGKYLTFLKTAYPDFMKEPFILWNQPWAEGEKSGMVSASTKPTTNPQVDKTSDSPPGIKTSFWNTFAFSSVVALIFLCKL